MKNSTNRKPVFSILFITIIFCLLLSQGLTADSAKKVYVIPVSGTVEPGMAAYVERALKHIADDKEALFIFEMDTFGGRVDSALQIVDTISNEPKGKTVAFVTKRAISAGALIALSCNVLYMKHSTTIGDCAPITYSSEGAQMMGEKFQSPLRAKFRALAKKNNYPSTLAESMVTMDMEVYKIEIDGKSVYMDKQEYEDLTDEEKKKITSKKTIVAEGELLTMTDAEAGELGFAQASVSDIDELLAMMDYKDYEIIRIEENWSESFVRFIQPFLPILMLIGFGALYTEIKAPGFGAPGIIGIIFLGLVFFNQYLAGLADHTELLLLSTGIVLLGIELFVIPGFGIAGIAGLSFIAIGLVLSMQDFVLPDPSFPWESELLLKNVAQVIASGFFAFIVSMLTIRYVLPKMSRVVSGPYLDVTLEDSHADSFEAMEVNVGDAGDAVTFLRPSGKIKINGRKIDAIAEGEFLEKGTPVIIYRIQGNRVIVSRKL